MAAGGLFTVEVVRGDVVESRHRIHAVVADRKGQVDAWGDRARPTIPRSAIKSIQALPLITTGAADAHGVSEEELALACASHSGEQAHTDAVAGWLDRIGLREDDLECGPDTPIGVQAKENFWASGSTPSPIYNGCSGKHTGFLTVTRHLGRPTAGYIEPDAPVQRLVTDAVATLTGLDLAQLRPGRDGCGIPVYAMPLERLAWAMARLVDPTDLDPDLAAAAERVVAAAQLAFWVSGTNRTEVNVAETALEPVVIKTGAEGVFMAGLPDRGLGIAVKVSDGTPRASRTAIRAVLRHLGALPPADGPSPIRNKAGREVGEIRAVVSTPASTVMDTALATL